jgi:hypothetical protein
MTNEWFGKLNGTLAKKHESIICPWSQCLSHRPVKLIVSWQGLSEACWNDCQSNSGNEGKVASVLLPYSTSPFCFNLKVQCSPVATIQGNSYMLKWRCSCERRIGSSAQPPPVNEISKQNFSNEIKPSSQGDAVPFSFSSVKRWCWDMTVYMFLMGKVLDFV